MIFRRAAPRSLGRWIRGHASVGFRPVGVLRRYERDTNGARWHDGLLMDLLAEELGEQR